MGKSSRFGNYESLSPGPPAYAQRVGECGITNPSHPLSTIRSTKNSILGSNEQRPPWHNRFNVTPAPGSYRLASDFGYVDFKSGKRRFPATKLHFDEAKIDQLLNTANTSRILDGIQSVPEKFPLKKRANRTINSYVVSQGDSPRRQGQVDDAEISELHKFHKALVETKKRWDMPKKSKSKRKKSAGNSMPGTPTQKMKRRYREAKIKQAYLEDVMHYKMPNTTATE